MKRFNQKLPFIFILLLLVSCRATETSVQIVKVEDKYEMKLPTSLTYQNNLMTKPRYNTPILKKPFLWL